MYYKKLLLHASVISLLPLLALNNSAFAANVTNEAEINAALGGVGGDPTINILNDVNLGSSLTLPDSVYTINGGGNKIYTYDGNGFNTTTNVTIDDLVIDDIKTYIKNSIAGNGGAINNTGSTFIIGGDTDFTSNSSGIYGGAIYNNGSAFIIDSNADFTSNSSGSNGGAIYNIGSTFTIGGTANFSDNYANAHGGAIFNNSSNVTIDGTANFSDNYADLYGGAIFNNSSNVTIDGTTDFNNNFAQVHGGALFNLNSKFLSNGVVNFFNNSALLHGGAVMNNGGKFTVNGLASFTGNSSGANGGAIFNAFNSDLIINNGASFTNNSASSLGGAIYNEAATATLIADTNNVEFTGNTASGVSNAVHMNNSCILNLNSSNTASVVFNDRITSAAGGNVININKAGDWDKDIATLAGSNKIRYDAPVVGEVVLNADMSGFDNADEAGNTINLYGGMLSVTRNGTFFDSVNFNASSGSTLNLLNGKIDTIALGASNIDNMNLKIDVDLARLTADTINPSSITNNDVTISNISVLDFGNGTSNSTVTVDPDNELNILIGDNAKTVVGPVYNYAVTSNGTGSISLTTQDLNPSTQATSVVQQTAFTNIATANNIAFDRVDNVLTVMDTIESQTGISYDNVNKVAALEGNAEYSNLYGRLEEGSGWFRPFSTIENINLNSTTGKVDSVSYGMMVGYDTPLKKIKRGFKRMFSFYGGYSGAKQGYKTIDLYQNSGFAGALAAVYKKNYYASIAGNVSGTGVVESIYGYGSSNYGMFATSLTSKMGYNLHLTDNTTLQLNNQLGYNFVNTQCHQNAQGVTIDSSPLHVIQMTPGFKLSKRFNGWQAYVASKMNFTPYNRSKVRANEMVLPGSKLGSFVEYGVGIEKQSKHSLGGFLQAMVRNGSRTGINFQFGLKIPIGRNVEQL